MYKFVYFLFYQFKWVNWNFLRPLCNQIDSLRLNLLIYNETNCLSALKSLKISILQVATCTQWNLQKSDIWKETHNNIPQVKHQLYLKLKKKKFFRVENFVDQLIFLHFHFRCWQNNKLLFFCSGFVVWIWTCDMKICGLFGIIWKTMNY